MKKKLMVPIDFHSMEKKIVWKSIGTINCLVTSILQNVFIFVQQKEEILAVNDDRIFFFLAELSL